MITHIYDDNFVSEVLNEENLVVVDFSASWCMPCKMLKMVLEQIADENEELKIVSLDVDESPITSTNYEIQSIPTLLFLKDGVVIDEVIGFCPKNYIQDIIDINM